MEKISRLVDSRLVVYLMNQLNITKQNKNQIRKNSSVVSDHLHFFAKCVQSYGIYSLTKEKWKNYQILEIIKMTLATKVLFKDYIQNCLTKKQRIISQVLLFHQLSEHQLFRQIFNC